MSVKLLPQGQLHQTVLDDMTKMRGANLVATDKRKVIKASLDEAIAYGNEIAAAKVNKDKQAIIDSKRSEVTYLTPEQRAAWVNAMKPVWAQFEDKIGKDLIDAAVASNE